jgi:hypothetical protein
MRHAIDCIDFMYVFCNFILYFGRLIAIVHCETSSGVINPVEEIALLARKYQPKASVFVDAMVRDMWLE